MQKVILITGASSGLGRMMSQELSSNNIVYAGTRNTVGINFPFQIKPIKLDVTDSRDCANAIKQILKSEGRIDALINCVGYAIVGPSLDFSDKDYLNILNTNLLGAFRLMREVVPVMKKQKYGRIINITSLNGLISLPNFGLYASSKFGLEALGTALRYELLRYGIWVTNIAPGAIFSNDKAVKNLPHKPAREKFKILSFLMPMVTQKTICQKIKRLLNSSRPPSRVILGIDAKIAVALNRYLPHFVWDFLMNFIWNKK